MRKTHWIVPMILGSLLLAAPLRAADVTVGPEDDWITAKGEAAGVGANAEDEATKAALRKAVEQATGVFLTSQSKTEDFKTVYEKIFANTVGYVKKYKVVKMNNDGKTTVATVQALVSKQRFEEDWANIAHTLNQENNPRVIVAIVEATTYSTSTPVFNEDNGMVQGKVEDFFLSKGITLMDRATAGAVNKRDVLLASVKDDDKELAAIGSRFKADVMVIGKATAKLGKELDIEGQKMYQYTASLNFRVIQTDSARVLVSKTYGPVTVSMLQQAGGEDKALAKLAEESAPKLLAAVVEAWRQRANVSRTVAVSVSGMDYAAWKKFNDEAKAISGMQALRLREITEGVANIDVEYKYSNENLADRLTELKGVTLEIQEITSNRIKMKLKTVSPGAVAQPEPVSDKKAPVPTPGG